MSGDSTFIEINLEVNGEARRVDVDVRDSLLDVLRDRLGLAGAKRGCDTGACGACTVWLDDEPVNACTVLAAEAAGRAVVTIEGLSPERLHPLQQAFVDHGAVQCGFCTPGMIMSAAAYVRAQGEAAPPPTRRHIRRALSGNLCRCTGYQKIVDAVQSVLQHRTQERAHG